MKKKLQAIGNVTLWSMVAASLVWFCWEMGLITLRIQTHFHFSG